MGNLSKLGRQYPREYTSWQGARNRCNNKNNKRYSDYGGRGIEMCERWDSFENFMEDMGPKPGLEYSLERIDNDGPYSPDNCRWATYKEQRLNKYNTQNITHPKTGETKTLGEWAEQAGLTYSCLHIRLTREGLDLETALNRPVRRKGKTKQEYKEWCERFEKEYTHIISTIQWVTNRCQLTPSQHVKLGDDLLKIDQTNEEYHQWLEDVDG